MNLTPNACNSRNRISSLPNLLWNRAVATPRDEVCSDVQFSNLKRYRVGDLKKRNSGNNSSAGSWDVQPIQEITLRPWRERVFLCVCVCVCVCGVFPGSTKPLGRCAYAK